MSEAVYFKQHRTLKSHWPPKSTVAKTSVVIFSTVKISFAKATRLWMILKAEVDHSI